MSVKKSHRDNSPCPLAGALDLVGDHWTLLVIRDIMFMGKREYKEMLASWEGISTNILADRLKHLKENGLIDSVTHPESGKRKLYYLTEAAKTLLPILCELARWGYEQQEHKTRAPHLDALMENPLKVIQKKVLKEHLQWERTMGITPE